MVKATIIPIGNEILIGKTVDTNSNFIAQKLDEIGVAVVEILTTRDEKQPILDALKRASEQSDIIVMTGGLGPTNDDITKKTLAEFFGVGMHRDEMVLDHVEQLFKRLNKPMLQSNMMQADIPDNCRVVINHYGTAPGMWFDHDNKVYLSMPGVPYEMKHLFTEQMLPLIFECFELPVIRHHYIQTVAMGESFMAEKLKDYEESLPDHINLAYLPSLGMVRLRLSAMGNDAMSLEDELRQHAGGIRDHLSSFVYGEGDDSLEEVIGRMLMEKNLRMATAESCTGGFIAHRITQIAGASEYFEGSMVTYTNEMKVDQLGVNPEIIMSDGAVSERCVIAMLNGLLDRLAADVGIAVSGIAGPGGGTPDKPVGTVWIAVGKKGDIKTRLYQFPGNRKQNIRMTALMALNRLRRYLMGQLDKQ